MLRLPSTLRPISSHLVFSQDLLHPFPFCRYQVEMNYTNTCSQLFSKPEATKPALKMRVSLSARCVGSSYLPPLAAMQQFMTHCRANEKRWTACLLRSFGLRLGTGGGQETEGRKRPKIVVVFSLNDNRDDELAREPGRKGDGTFGECVCGGPCCRVSEGGGCRT